MQCGSRLYFIFKYLFKLFHFGLNNNGAIGLALMQIVIIVMIIFCTIKDFIGADFSNNGLVPPARCIQFFFVFLC